MAERLASQCGQRNVGQALSTFETLVASGHLEEVSAS